MRVIQWFTLLLLLAVGCQDAMTAKCKTSFPSPKAMHLEPSKDSQEEVQQALLRAKPGDTIWLGEGTFEFTQGLTLAVENVTLRGKGVDKTVLSFKNQAAESAGLLVTRGDFVLEDLSFDDAKGDGLKVLEADGVILRRVQARWTGKPISSYGAYGLYLVQCKNVLIEDCITLGASAGGIGVGESQNVVVRRCRAEQNVAGIEIENCIDADVYENSAENNAGGILVFDVPGLQIKNGRRVRVFDNHLVSNNHSNFANPARLLASIPSGTGVMVLATDEVEVFRNTIKDHQTLSVTIASYHVTGRPLQDKDYDPVPEGITVHHNDIVGGGHKPGGELGLLLATLVNTPIPDILYDGVENSARRVDGKLPPQFGISIRDNGRATFANLHWSEFDPKAPLKHRDKVTRDLKPHDFDIVPLPAAAIRKCP